MSSQQSNFRHPIKSSKNITKKIIQNSSNIIRVKSEQNIKPYGELVMDEEKIEYQLMKEIENAKRVIQSYEKNLVQTYKLENIKKEGFKITEENLEILRFMQENIVEKDAKIKHITEEIKCLKNAPDKLKVNLTSHYKSLKDAQLFILADEILVQREQLQSLQKIHASKKTDFQKRQKNMRILENKYFQLHYNSGIKCISYEQFKQAKKKKEENQKSLKKGTKKVFQNVKQMKDNKQAKETVENEYPINKISSNSTNNLKEVRNKKQIAEGALKTAKKKHLSELNELKAKLDFLRDENEELEIKLQQKNKELEAADNRFSEKNNLSRGKKIRK